MYVCIKLQMIKIHSKLILISAMRSKIKSYFDCLNMVKKGCRKILHISLFLFFYFSRICWISFHFYFSSFLFFFCLFLFSSIRFRFFKSITGKKKLLSLLFCNLNFHLFGVYEIFPGTKKINQFGFLN